jgi:diaminohydroxyphosphoribosylaminopyrimidine deaminase / 5-amino-6-(5-phosphoribosylamino)uracil reductase
MNRTDVRLMRRALALAERGRGRTRPNPPVGAVIAQSEKIVGEAWHHAAGEPHAEALALEAAGEAARDATLYVTLEPCTTHGRTPPCAPRLIAAGIRRVVVGAIDPNPAVDGAGIRMLESAGIEVAGGVLDAEAGQLLAPFAKYIRTGRPLVTAKMAATLDGRTAALDGSSRWITGPSSRRDVHRLRSVVDAVMVGVGTVVKDDPELTVRLRGYRGPQPIRVILDSSGRTPVAAKVCDGSAPTLLYTTEKAPEDSIRALVLKGVEVVRFQLRDGRVDLGGVLDDLGRRGLLEVLLEGGPTVLGDAVEGGLVDRYVLYLAPKLLGSSGAPMLSGLVVGNVADARELTITSVRRTGADLRIEAEPRR